MKKLFILILLLSNTACVAHHHGHAVSTEAVAAGVIMGSVIGAIITAPHDHVYAGHHHHGYGHWQHHHDRYGSYQHSHSSGHYKGNIYYQRKNYDQQYKAHDDKKQKKGSYKGQYGHYKE